jgi:hypothetical protein
MARARRAEKSAQDVIREHKERSRQGPPIEAVEGRAVADVIELFHRGVSKRLGKAVQQYTKKRTARAEELIRNTLLPMRIPTEHVADVVDAKDLIEAFRVVAPSVATEDYRFGLNGSYLDGRLDDVEHTPKLTLVGTNGHTMALRTFRGKKHLLAGRWLFPRDAHRRLAGLTGPVRIGLVRGFTGTDAFPGVWLFEARSGQVRMPAIEGEFPDYTVILSHERDPVRVDRKKLLAAVKSLTSGAILTGLDADGRWFVASGGGTGIVNRGKGPTAAEYEAPPILIPAKADPNRHTHGWRFQRDYFLDALKNTPDAEIRIEGQHYLSPVTISGLDTTHVVMPQRLDFGEGEKRVDDGPKMRRLQEGR